MLASSVPTDRQSVAPSVVLAIGGGADGVSARRQGGHNLGVQALPSVIVVSQIGGARRIAPSDKVQVWIRGRDEVDLCSARLTPLDLERVIIHESARPP